MPYLRSGFTQVMRAIRKHRVLFLILILLQTALLISSASVLLHYQVQIQQNAREVIQSLETANFNPEELRKGQLFLNNPGLIYSSYRLMINNLYYLGFFLLLLHLVLNGSLWIISHYLISGHKNVQRQFLQFTVFTLILVVFFLFISKIILRTVVNPDGSSDQFTVVMKVILGLAFFFYLLLLQALAVLSSSWKTCFFEIWLKIKQIRFTLPILIINFTVISITLYGIYFSLSTQYSLLLVLITLILILNLVLTRLYWLACLKELE